MPKFEYRVCEHLGTMSDNGQRLKAVRVISYGGGSPIYDIRLWQPDKSLPGGERMLKGICLNADEMTVLKTILNGVDPEAKLLEYQQKGVNRR